LIQTPAAVRFISVEPMLGPLDLRLGMFPSPIRRLDWVICGAETGPHKRPMSPAWADSIHEQCKAAGVPFFGKVDSDGKPMGPREWLGGGNG